MELHMRNFDALGLIPPVRLASLVTLALAVAGCGGGGGGGSSSSDCPTAFSTSCGTGGTAAADGTIALSLTDAASGLSSNTLSAGKPLTVKALVKDAKGVVVPNAVVSFTTDGGLAVFEPVSGTALTDSKGVASINLQAASLASSGAATLTVAATVSGKTFTQTIGYAVSPGTVALANLAANSTSLSAYASTSISVQVLLNGAPATAAQTVIFSSACDTAGKASISRSVSSVNGVATATYTDKGCAGTDTITASVQGTSSSLALQIAPPQASNVSFMSATPSSIVLAGTGGEGLSSDSIVTFKLVDSTNSPIAGKAVNFDLSTRVGGIKLNGQSTGVVQGTTGADGTVSVTVTAGTVPTPVWVTAVLADNTAIKSQSPNLTISTGRPTQDRFSLAVETFNIEGAHIDGVTTKLSVRAYDRLGNPVVDGTVVNFISEGGGVQPFCNTKDGACSVEFTSAEFRPANGRVTVLAYAQGEESFDDLNTNNVWDRGEPFRNLGDAFVDNNEDGIWQLGEREIAFDPTKTLACPAYPADGRYSNAPYKANTCDDPITGWGAAHVRRTAVIALSSHIVGSLAPSSFTTPACKGNMSRAFKFKVSDENNNPLPAGTTIDKATAALTWKYVDTGNLATMVGGDGVSFEPAVVPDTPALGGTEHYLILKADCSTEISVSGSVTVRFTSPSGKAVTRDIQIN